MKTIDILLIIALACACQKIDTQEDVSIPLSFNVVTEQSSRGLPLPDNNNPDTIGLMITEGTTDQPYDGKPEYLNVKATLKNGIWETDIPVYVSSKPATIYAYSPSNLDISNPKAIPVNGRFVDLLLAKNENINNDNPEVNIKFHHALARIRVRIYYFGTDPDCAEARSILLGGDNSTIKFAMFGTVDINTEKFSKTSTSSSSISFLLNETFPMYDTSDENFVEALVFPLKFNANELSFRMQTTGLKSGRFSLPAGEWLPGSINEYTLVFQPK